MDISTGWLKSDIQTQLLISAQLALEMCLGARNRQKSIKHLFWRSRSPKVIEFGGN